MNCWNTLETLRHNVTGDGERDGLRRRAGSYTYGQSAAKHLARKMKVQRPSRKGVGLQGTEVRSAVPAMPDDMVCSSVKAEVATTRVVVTPRQNIPKPDNDKWGLRKSFIASPGHSLLVLDYKQLEMRVLAIMSGEKPMQDIFRRNWDIHMGNASLMYGMPYDDIDSAKKIDKKVKEGLLPESAITAYVHECLKARDYSKTIGFGLNYGMGEFTLSRRLKCTVEEAAKSIRKYMDTYPAVERFLEESIKMAHEEGCVYTMLGRRRWCSEIYSRSRALYSRGTRIATNSRIQGSAADVAKVAMTNFFTCGLDKQFGAKMLLQVHDEVIYEIPNETIAEATPYIKDSMEFALPIAFPVTLEVDHGTGPNWAKAK